VTLTAYDVATQLATARAQGREPVFDGWLLTDVISWCLARAGIPEDKRVIGTHIEDLQMRLPKGDRLRPAWQIRPGRSLLEFLQELLSEVAAGAVLWVDEDGNVHVGCRYCRTRRNPEDWMLHDGWASDGCLAADQERTGGTGIDFIFFTRPQKVPEDQQTEGPGEIIRLLRRQRASQPEDYVNRVVAIGRPRQGGQPWVVGYFEADAVVYSDDADEKFVGFYVDDVVILPAASSEAELGRAAWEEYRDRAHRPQIVEVTVPFFQSVELRPGRVFEIRGAEAADLDGARFRITRVHHMLNRTRISTTTVEGGRIA